MRVPFSSGISWDGQYIPFDCVAQVEDSNGSYFVDEIELITVNFPKELPVANMSDIASDVEIYIETYHDILADQVVKLLQNQDVLT